VQPRRRIGFRGARPRRLRRTVQRRKQLLEPLTAQRRNRHRFGVGNQLGRLRKRKLRIRHVRLRDRHDPVLYTELPQHREVLSRLGHDAVVGGDAHQE
jgi:hypothetical protein